jgi:outer membrane protein assembly factor BamD (BamD/ComL family)
MIVIPVFFSGCSDNKAEEFFETAQFEELQNNREHAIQLYEEIIEKYPESEYAKKAQDRLLTLKK